MSFCVYSSRHFPKILDDVFIFVQKYGTIFRPSLIVVQNIFVPLTKIFSSTKQCCWRKYFRRRNNSVDENNLFNLGPENNNFLKLWVWPDARYALGLWDSNRDDFTVVDENVSLKKLSSPSSYQYRPKNAGQNHWSDLNFLKKLNLFFRKYK